MSQADLRTTDDIMVPMGLSQFPTGKTLLSDVYVRLHTDKYVQLGKRGQACHFDEMHAFQDKKINTVFVHQDVLKEFVTSSLLHLSVVEITPATLDTKIVEILQAIDLVTKQIQFMGLNQESFENLKIVSKSLREFTKLNSHVTELVHRFKSLPGNNDMHSICVSSLATMIGLEMGWNSENMLEKLSLSGLLHDVGLQKMPLRILRKPYDLMDTEEKAIYETHPYLGAQMLRNVPGISSEIISVAYEHHENSIGKGFPRRLDDSKMHPLSKVVALADQFTELVLPRADEEPFKPIQALNYIENILGQPFNVDCHKAFRKIFSSKN